jgi:hypothetical protein
MPANAYQKQHQRLNSYNVVSIKKTSSGKSLLDAETILFEKMRFGNAEICLDLVDLACVTWLTMVSGTYFIGIH